MSGAPFPREGLAAAAGTSRPTLLICFACLLLPWLNPFTAGPSPSVVPWLFSATCGATAFGIARTAALRPAARWGLAALVGWVLLRSGLTPETMALAAACLLVFLAASVAAGGSQQPEFVRVIALGWLAAAALGTAIALLQYFRLDEHLAPLVSRSSEGEAFANLRQRNQFASLTVIGMASLFWLVPRSIGRWPALALVAWLAVGNAATTSRTGLGQILALGLFACLWPGPRRTRAMLWVGALLAYLVAAIALPWSMEWAAGVAGGSLWNRLAAADPCSSRAVLWSNVLHLLTQKPWLGWGWGELDYAHYATLYEGPRFCDILDNAHSLPMHLAVELGLPATLLACGGFLWAIVRAKPWRDVEPARQMAWAVLAMICLHSLAEYPLWYGPFQIALGLCLGLLWPAADVCAAVTGYARAAKVALAASMVGACAYAAWDYRRVSQIYLPPEARAPEYRSDPMGEIRRSWLFRNQARFAELTIAAQTRANAQWTFDTASELLHYSPEPRVVEKLIESGVALGRSDELVPHLARFRAAFPDRYSAWSQARAGGAFTRP